MNEIKHARILIVDDHPKNIQVVGKILSNHGYRSIIAKNGIEALKASEKVLPDLILLDVMMPEMDGYETCRHLKESPQTRDIPVIFLTAKTETEDIVQGFELGAVDYVNKPFNSHELLARIRTHLELKQYREHLKQLVSERTAELQEAYDQIKKLQDRLENENSYLREQIEVRFRHQEIVGESDGLREILLQIEQVAVTDSTVLLLGETGTGKEVLARAVHQLSSRNKRSMITMNCAALPSNLVESELFGHEKGAFTGAVTQKMGRFEVANESTLFLDEIGEMPLELQAKLLRVLQEQKFERLGSSKTREVDVRIIAATNQDLTIAVREGRFREDLYYRLNVFPVAVPPLRQRTGDIPLLVWSFVKEFEKSMGKSIERIPKKSMDAMQAYSWPGNIRELRNVIERAMILSREDTLQITLPRSEVPPPSISMTLEEMERQHILEILEQSNWRVRGQNGASEILGLKPSTLESRMQKLGIRRNR
ncbi:MAG: sigma-54-dependent Fis family transcriptional regulator [SAR324 cluster bacterium]|nr:sigma-54-dependent Fis family transcriptional regulator [SAR324 cluster bacterium]